MTKRAGSDARQTRERLIVAAKEEFLIKGYKKGSLRDICKAAKVTTGALYFLFEGKEDLFISVLEPWRCEFFRLLKEHFAKESIEMQVKGETLIKDDFDLMDGFLELCYGHTDICELILNHRDHPYVAELFDETIEILDRQMELLAGGAEQALIDKETIHWFSHLQVDAFLNVISHAKTKEDAKGRMKNYIRFLRAGFVALLNSEDNQH